MQELLRGNIRPKFRVRVLSDLRVNFLILYNVQLYMYIRQCFLRSLTV